MNTHGFQYIVKKPHLQSFYEEQHNHFKRNLASWIKDPETIEVRGKQNDIAINRISKLDRFSSRYAKKQIIRENKQYRKRIRSVSTGIPSKIKSDYMAVHRKVKDPVLERQRELENKGLQNRITQQKAIIRYDEMLRCATEQKKIANRLSKLKLNPLRSNTKPSYLKPCSGSKLKSLSFKSRDLNSTINTHQIKLRIKITGKYQNKYVLKIESGFLKKKEYFVENETWIKDNIKLGFLNKPKELKFVFTLLIKNEKAILEIFGMKRDSYQIGEGIKEFNIVNATNEGKLESITLQFSAE